MKSTINNIVLISLFTLLGASCSSSNKKQEQEANVNIASLIQDVDSVVAIGKVQSENGNYILSSGTSGIIKQILVNEGDTVTKGSKLIVLSNISRDIDYEIAASKVNTLKDQLQVAKKELDQEKVELNYQRERYTSSKSLYDKGAETKENLLLDQTNFLKQQERVNSLLAQVKASENQVREQSLQVQKTNILAEESIIVAPGTGLITSLTINIGQSINSSESLGTIDDLSELIIEAEVDELFANQIQIGQNAVLKSINTKQIVGQGTVIYASPILVNKSILFESANEAEDRRVRKIKIKPAAGINNLLINAKIECQIKTK